MNINFESWNMFLPAHYLQCFDQHPTWISFFEKHDIPYFIESSTTASILNAQMIYHLLSFKKLNELVQLLDGDIQSRLYIASLYCKENYELPYMDIFSGDLKYQHYRSWRLLFSLYLKRHKYHCDTSLIHFIMTTIDDVFEWEFYQINITLTLFYEWIVEAKKHHLDFVLCTKGHNFESFIYHVSCALFKTQDDYVLVSQLCKRFSLAFEGVESFDILIRHFKIWNGDRNFCNQNVFKLSSTFTSVMCNSELKPHMVFF